VKNIFQQTETFIPHLKAQLTNAGGKRNLALCGMPGSGKTTIARRVYEELKDGYDKHHFMTVSQTPDLFQLLKSAGKELFGMREFDFEGPAGLRDDLMKKLRKEGGKKVLLVLDDVWDRNHLDVLNFATGIQKDREGKLLRHDSSRLLVTTRDRRVLSDLQERNRSLLRSRHC
jgi:GTPase SAR1 family protein